MSLRRLSTGGSRLNLRRSDHSLYVLSVAVYSYTLNHGDCPSVLAFVDINNISVKCKYSPLLSCSKENSVKYLKLLLYV